MELEVDLHYKVQYTYEQWYLHVTTMYNIPLTDVRSVCKDMVPLNIYAAGNKICLYIYAIL